MRLLKTTPGKTVREHIQDRLLHEAKSLLVQTDLDINTISDGLGFSGQAAFNTFFRKKENVSFSLFRRNILMPDSRQRQQVNAGGYFTNK